MRFVHKTLAFLISTGCLLASTADARAQSCNNFTPKDIGNFQIQLGDNLCGATPYVSVTVDVTQDIIVAAETNNQTGIGFQLNTNGPKTPAQGHLNAVQFLVRADTTHVEGYEQLFPPSVDPAQGNYPTMASPSAVNGGFATIHAGTQFVWTVNINTSAYPYLVTGCTLSGTDTDGTYYQTVTLNIPMEDQSPLYSLSMDILGYGGCSNATFKSGAGIITYAVSDLTPSYNQNGGNGPCANNFGTCEQSNMVYGPMVPGNGTWTQTFSASEVANFRNGDCEPSSTYPSGDWAYGDYKAECPLGAPVYGVSRIPGQTWSNDIECGMPQLVYTNSGGACYARAVESIDNRGYTGDGDWDPESYKTECNWWEYVAGVSQSSGNGELTSILCCPANVTHQSCDTQPFYNSDSPAMSIPPDWDPTHYKGQCKAGQYVAGISTPAYSSVGITGAAHALLCCSQ